MNTFGITPKSYELIIEALKKYPQVEKVLIFGSRAKGNYKTGSDIDLAIQGKNCNAELAANICGYLNEEIPVPYFIDVVDYASLQHNDLKAHIDKVGLLFFQKDLRVKKV